MNLGKGKKRVLEIALRKCRRVGICQIYADCTPSEYFLLWEYLKLNPKDRDPSIQKGIYNNPRTVYFTVPRHVAEIFQKSRYYS